MERVEFDERYPAIFQPGGDGLPVHNVAPVAPVTHTFAPVAPPVPRAEAAEAPPSALPGRLPGPAESQGPGES